MRKIVVFAAIVVVLIAIIKFGGSLMNLAVEGEKPVQTSKVDAGIPEVTSQDVTNSEVTTPESKITIEIQNETETSESETAIVESETQPEVITEAAIEEKVYKVTAFSKTMYATKSVHVRANCSTDSEVVSSLRAGQEIHATGESENGWIRTDYAGKPAYVSKSYLSTTKPAAEKKAATATTAAPSNTPIRQPAATQPSTQPAAGPESATPPLIVPPPPIG